MYIFSSFEYSTKLELAISELEENGIQKEQILAIPLDKRTEKRKLFDTIHYSDGVSLVDIAAITGTIFMLFGAIYGFVLEWGPIIWGLIGLFIGIIFGFIIDLLYTKSSLNNKSRKAIQTEIILLVKCNKEEAEKVKQILWDHFSLGVGYLDR